MNKVFRLYAQPSALSGAARLVDLGGIFDRYNHSQTEAEADSRALASDWTAVANDLREAMKQMSSQLRSKGPLHVGDR